MIRFNCPHCGKTISAKDENAGTANKCPNPTCGKPVQVPVSLSSEQATSVPPPPPPTPPSIVIEKATQKVGSGGLLGWFTRAFGATTGVMIAIAIAFIATPFLCCGGCLAIIGILGTPEQSENHQPVVVHNDTNQDQVMQEKANATASQPNEFADTESMSEEFDVLYRPGNPKGGPNSLRIYVVAVNDKTATIYFRKLIKANGIDIEFEDKWTKWDSSSANKQLFPGDVLPDKVTYELNGSTVTGVRTHYQDTSSVLPHGGLKKWESKFTIELREEDRVQPGSISASVPNLADYPPLKSAIDQGKIIWEVDLEQEDDILNYYILDGDKVVGFHIAFLGKDTGKWSWKNWEKESTAKRTLSGRKAADGTITINRVSDGRVMKLSSTITISGTSVSGEIIVLTNFTGSESKNRVSGAARKVD